MSRIATVFGATGTQGSSVIEAILADKTFKARAVTRDVSSVAASQLRARGVEVVFGDLWKADSLEDAVRGSECVFGFTNYLDPSVVGGDKTGEVEQGKNLVDACKKAGVEFFVWSGLPDPVRISGGKHADVQHFNNKAVVEVYLRSSGLPNASVYPGWFTENLWTFKSLSKTEDDSYELVVPCFSETFPQAFTWVSKDFGPSVLALFKNYDVNPEVVLNKAFFPVTERMIFPDFAKLLAEVLGKPVVFKSPPTSGLPELDAMYKFESEFDIYEDAAVPDPRLVAMGAKFGTLKEFVDVVVKERGA